MMMIGLLVMAALVVVGLIMRRRAGAQQPAMAGAGAMQYAAGNPAPAAATPQGYDVARPRAGNDAVANTFTQHEGPAAVVRIPADFDVTGFERQAKVNFIRLQAANDAANLDDLREFTTPEMFAELKTSILERGDVSQRTEVLEINAEVLEVVEDASRYVVSVRFSGLIREEGDAPAESVSEIWHLVKPRHGSVGWLLAGIQQES